MTTRYVVPPGYVVWREPDGKYTVARRPPREYVVTDGHRYRSEALAELYRLQAIAQYLTDEEKQRGAMDN